MFRKKKNSLGHSVPPRRSSSSHPSIRALSIGRFAVLFPSLIVMSNDGLKLMISNVETRLSCATRSAYSLATPHKTHDSPLGNLVTVYGSMAVVFLCVAIWTQSHLPRRFSTRPGQQQRARCRRLPRQKRPENPCSARNSVFECLSPARRILNARTHTCHALSTLRGRVSFRVRTENHHSLNWTI